MKTLICEIYESYHGADISQPFRWRLRAGNRKIIATGHEGFSSASKARRAFNNVADRLTRTPWVFRDVAS